MTASVYVIQAGSNGPVKIGIARDPQRRLSSLASGSPVRLRLRHVEPALHPREVERGTHQRLAAKRFKGEWFDVTVEEAVGAIRASKSPPPRDSRLINFRATAETLRDIDFIRRHSDGPVPNVASVVRGAINAYAAELKQTECPRP